MIWLLSLLAFLFLSILRAPLFVWLLVLGITLFVAQLFSIFVWIVYGAIGVCIGIPYVRRKGATRFIMWVFKKWQFFPKISKTEREALEAGKTWVEKEIFSGHPDLKKLATPPLAQLTLEEESFLNNETEQLCSMIDDWKIYTTREIPKEVDDFVRKNKFLGINIPKSYGGLGFSHQAHGKILEKICSHSYAIGIYVMVPNSLGPGELLVRYGTSEQKKHYLPRLADGRDIPCFGLTEPRVGSDAAAIESYGELFKDENGELKIKLNWNKRWITLASVSSLLGIAFNLKDPDEILNQGQDIGITCALVPSQTAGVELGRRHDPMGIPFPNCPTLGKDVIISADFGIIGGIEKAGQGWNMLMECLGTGRGISLPSSSLASSKRALRSSVYFSQVRRQFGLPVGKFEGVQELLSSMIGKTYLSQSMLSYTMSALSRHISSGLCSAMLKYKLTEMARKNIINGMDIMGGSGISMGPRNLLALSYIGAPIAITVEGANVLTRSFIIFGQGVMRAHPFAYKEIKALEDNDRDGFDLYFWNHIGHVIQNTIISIFITLTRGLFVWVPEWRGCGYRGWQKIAWGSCLFAVLSEIAMVAHGGRLKIKEQLTGRFADVLMGLYMASSVLWYWKKHPHQKEMWPFVQWSLDKCFSDIQKGFEGILNNFDHKILYIPLKIIYFVLRLNSFGREPSDKLSQKLCETLFTQPEMIHRLSEGIFSPQEPSSQLKKLEECYLLSIKNKPLERKIKKAQKKKQIESGRLFQVYNEAFEKGILNSEEYKQFKEWIDKSWEVIQVDSFTQEEYVQRR